MRLVAEIQARKGLPGCECASESEGFGDSRTEWGPGIL